MENLLYNISQVLGVSVLQSLWQGLLVWFVMRFVFMCVPNLSAIKKHNLAVAAILVLTGWFAYTFIVQVQAHNWMPLSAAEMRGLVPYLKLPANIVATTSEQTRYYYVIEGYLPYISILYILGLMFNLVKFGMDWQKMDNIKQSMTPAPAMQQLVNRIAGKLNIEDWVQVNFSHFIDVPCITGFFKPIILLPVTLTTQLSAEEVEAILLHELSHIKRNDYVLNMLQQCITIILFFNPFAQLINRIINQERENSCDDLVVQTTAQPLIYARALLKLEQTRYTNLQLALAATGKKYHLLNRIERIMKTKKPIGNVRHLLVGIAIMTAGISSIAWLNPTVTNGKISVKKISYPAIVQSLTADTTHKVVKTKKTIAAKKARSVKPDYPYGGPYGIVNDNELERLTAEVQKHAEVISQYYNSPEFKRQIELAQLKGKAIEDYYNRPDVRKLYDEQAALGSDFAANSKEAEEIGKQMSLSGNKMSEYYNSAAFKEMVNRLETKYHIPHNRMYVSRDSADWDDNYKKFQAEIGRNIPADVKKQQEILTQLGAKMKGLYDTPEFKARNQKIQALADSIKSAGNNADIQQLQIDMGVQNQKMHAFQNSAQIKQQQKLLDEASKKLKNYTNSPAFKKRMLDYKKAAEAAINDQDNRKDFQPAEMAPTDSF